MEVESRAIRLQKSMGRALVGFFLIGLLASCTAADRGLERDDLFTIPIGTLPGELDWFYQGSESGVVDIQTRNGLIYISNSRRGKIMVFNSYGDLLTIVYDPSKNSILSSSEDGNLTSSISSWQFRFPHIISASNEGFLVVDRIESEFRNGLREDRQSTMFNRVILRFDKDGNYLGHLGREGLGGSPFPDILAIDTRHDNTIVVTCYQFLSGTWISYWYTEDGYPITTIQIKENQLPGIADGNDISVQIVRPDPREWLLHLKADIYSRMDPGKKLESRLYTLDLSTFEYTESISLLHDEEFTDMGYPLGSPEYLGTTLNGSHAMLYTEGPNTYRIHIINAQGRIVYNRQLEIGSDSKIYRRFKMQNDGLLVGIFFGSSKATVSWWRFDEILKK